MSAALRPAWWEEVEALADVLAEVQQLPVTPVRRRDDPLTWAHQHAVLRTGDGRELRYSDVARDYQDTLLADQSDRIIVAKSRQIGISQTVAFLAAVEALNGGTAVWISRDEEQASKALDYVYIALSRAPHPPYKTENRQSLEFVDGGAVFTEPATRAAGRGIAASLLIIDEMAWQRYATEIYTAALPTLATTNGRLIVLSSANGRGNLFYNLWRAAQEPGSGWSCHFLPWQVQPEWVTEPDWAARKKATDLLTEEAFAQEYAVDFLVSGAAVFAEEEIAALWRMPSLLAPEPDHRYVTAWDIARKQDAFVGFTFDVVTAPFRVVAYERHLRLPYPEQARAIEQRAALYPGETWVESNGVGDPLIQFLAIPVRAFTTTALTKRNALDALKLLLQRHELISPLILEWRNELTMYQHDDKGLMQDTVMASAIAAQAAGRPVATIQAVSVPGFGVAGGTRTRPEPVHNRHRRR